MVAKAPSTGSSLSRAALTRQLRDAVRAEDRAVIALLKVLHRTQGNVRAAFALMGAQNASEYTQLLARLDPIWASARTTLHATLVTSMLAQATIGVAIVDDTLERAGINEPLAPSQPEAFLTDTVDARAKVYVADAVDTAAKAARLEALRYANAERSLEETLAAVGAALLGSAVFGRSAERLAGLARAQIGQAQGTGFQDRAERAGERVGGLRKVWIADSRPSARPNHVSAEARYAAGIPVPEDFQVGSYRAAGPRMPGLPGVERLHCLCMVGLLPPD